MAESNSPIMPRINLILEKIHLKINYGLKKCNFECFKFGKAITLNFDVMKKLLFVLLTFIAISLSAQDAKYEIKSAIIKKKMVMMDRESESVTYVDDYGKKESTEMTLNFDGNESRIRTINDGTSSVSVNLDTKEGFRGRGMRGAQINYLQLTPEVKERYKIKETGEEEFLGKACKKYSFEVTMGEWTMQVKTWVWKGIALKSETSNDRGTWSETATSIQENVAVPADKFTIPEGTTIRERN